MESRAGLRRGAALPSAARVDPQRRRHVQHRRPGRTRGCATRRADTAVLHQQHRGRRGNGRARGPSASAQDRRFESRHRHSVPVEPPIRRADSRDAPSRRRSRRCPVCFRGHFDIAVRRHAGGGAGVQRGFAAAGPIRRLCVVTERLENHGWRVDDAAPARVRHRERRCADHRARRNRARGQARIRPQGRHGARFREGGRRGARETRLARAFDRVRSCRHRRTRCRPASRSGRDIRIRACVGRGGRQAAGVAAAVELQRVRRARHRWNASRLRQIGEPGVRGRPVEGGPRSAAGCVDRSAGQCRRAFRSRRRRAFRHEERGRSLRAKCERPLFVQDVSSGQAVSLLRIGARAGRTPRHARFRRRVPCRAGRRSAAVHAGKGRGHAQRSRNRDPRREGAAVARCARRCRGGRVRPRQAQRRDRSGGIAARIDSRRPRPERHGEFRTAGAQDGDCRCETQPCRQ